MIVSPRICLHGRRDPCGYRANPLGVPSRMKLRLETHLGWAAKELGRNLGKMLDAGQKPPNSENDVRHLLSGWNGRGPGQH